MQIRQGCYYKRRDGVIVGPSTHNNNTNRDLMENENYPWVVNNKTYTDKGNYLHNEYRKNDQDKHPLDLVEWVEHIPVVPAPIFPINDKTRSVSLDEDLI